MGRMDRRDHALSTSLRDARGEEQDSVPLNETRLEVTFKSMSALHQLSRVWYTAARSSSLRLDQV